MFRTFQSGSRAWTAWRWRPREQVASLEPLLAFKSGQDFAVPATIDTEEESEKIYSDDKVIEELVDQESDLFEDEVSDSDEQDDTEESDSLASFSFILVSFSFLV